MEEIFREDRTVHISPTLFFIPTENNTVNENSCTLTTSTYNDQSRSRSAPSIFYIITYFYIAHIVQIQIYVHYNK